MFDNRNINHILLIVRLRRDECALNEKSKIEIEIVKGVIHVTLSTGPGPSQESFHFAFRLPLLISFGLKLAICCWAVYESLRLMNIAKYLICLSDECAAAGAGFNFFNFFLFFFLR